VRVLVAPDSFKGNIGAAGAASALAVGWRRVRPGDDLLELPLVGGGEGSLEVLAASTPGCRWRQAEVSGPGEERVSAAWLEMPGLVAVVELAAAAGLPLMSEPKPLAAHSHGVGGVIRHAAGEGARRIVVNWADRPAPMAAVVPSQLSVRDSWTLWPGNCRAAGATSRILRRLT
jgi:glycerate kinase